MKHTVYTHISLTAMLLLASFATMATTTTLQVPLAGTVFVPLNNGSFDEVDLTGRVAADDLIDDNVGEAEQAVQTVKTTLRINGRFATLILADGDTNGFLSASKDSIDNTSALDFSYGRRNPSDPNQAILVSGVGQIPNSSFTVDDTTGHLELTTAFPVTECLVDLTTGRFTCAPTTPKSFNLTWVKNGFGTVHERTNRTELFGPVTTKFHGDFSLVTALVNGTWADRNAVDSSGDLLDTKSTNVTREIEQTF